MEQKWGRAPAFWLWTALAALWLAVFPLWQTGSYSCITRAKWEGMIALTIATAACVLVFGVVCLARRQGAPFRLGLPQALALAYFAWLGLAACLGAYHGQLNANGQLAVWMGSKRYEGMATQLCYCAIFLMMSLHPPRMDWLLRLAAAALVALCAVVALQYAGLNPLGLFPAGLSTRTNYEFQGTIGNIDMVSGYLSLMIPLLLGGFVLAPRGDGLWLLAGLMGILLEACMEVQSGLIALALGAALLLALMMRRPTCRCRGWITLCGAALCLALRQVIALPWLDGVEQVSLVALSKAGAVLLVMALVCAGAAWLRYRHPGSARAPWQVLVAALLAAALVLALVLLLPLEASFGGLWELREVLLGRGQDSFGSYRLGVWRHTLAMARENLLFGNGPDTFWFAFKAHLTKVGATLPESFDNPHNEYLAILANAGLPALAIYLALLGATLLRCLRAAPARRRTPPYALALMAALLCYAAQGFFSFSICLVSPMFWAVMGMAAAWPRRRKG